MAESVKSTENAESSQHTDGEAVGTPPAAPAAGLRLGKNISISRRMMNWLILGLVVILVGATLLMFQRATAAPNNTNSAQATQTAAYQEALKQGIDLGKTPAPNFTLPDQNGAAVTLDQLRGHPVVLTFFDSVCPHADCTLIAQYISWTARDMGAKNSDVSWVALSVDPWHDTPTTAKAFLSSRQVTIPLHYLLGNLGQMTPIWNDYHMQAQIQSDGVVIHTTGIYVIDAQGRERMYFDEGTDPRAMSAYIQHLLTESGNSSAASGSSSGSQANKSVTLSQKDKATGDTIDFTATPSTFGAYVYTVTVSDGSGTPIQGAQVSLDMIMPAMEMTPLHVSMPPMDPPVPGSYQAQNVLSMRGQWRAQVQILPPGSSHPVQATFTFNANY